MAASSKALDPRSFIVIKPLPIPPQKGLKIRARSSTVYSPCEPSRQQVFRENYLRREKQISEQGHSAAIWRPYQELGGPLYLEPRTLLLHSLGQLEQAQDSKTDLEAQDPQNEVQSVTSNKGSQRSRTLPVKLLQLKYREKELKNLGTNLSHTRRLVSAVKQGRGYFQLLRKEEDSRRKEQLRAQREEAEKRRTECQPSQRSSDEENSEEEENAKRFFKTETPLQRSARRSGKKKQAATARPFTPLHSSLISPSLSDTAMEPIFRQLCALNWLLEALTTEQGAVLGPASSCWSLRDPGNSRAALKRHLKEKTIDTRWEQFVTQSRSKKSGSRSLQRQLLLRSRKLSFLSVSRLSTMSSAATPTLGSTSSLAPGLEELPMGSSLLDLEAAGESEEWESIASGSLYQSKPNKEEEKPISDYLQKLLETVHQSISKEMEMADGEKSSSSKSCPALGQSPGGPSTWTKDSLEKQVSMDGQTPRPKSSPHRCLSETSHFIASKSYLSDTMRTKFCEVTEDAALCLHDSLETLERKRQENSTHKFQSLEHVTQFHRDVEKMRKTIRSLEATQQKEKKSEEAWFSSLLSALPSSVKDNINIQQVLKRLARFGERPNLRIRAHHFLKVLGGLRTWELCSPDISVAIEMVLPACVMADFYFEMARFVV
ncbi:coiled-coil domain-containing protein 60 isoform X2 [Latimeria chalumnae]|uniref:coiled-coil domain-containing protein 60 isoform X2 n=1 Tax=Latimeria chalumnae TaxID=7897 RepID=UPI0003C1B0A5|nr:PREDICTED: coiled-coil domain-containing protein 60 isoform X2 [Latimeria chalumnae]|eukprot:XP_005993352.1 PREDICTED: coiled-coil domain-containing protein 60 isoform X2 [Latimeria chalumnae]